MNYNSHKFHAKTGFHSGKHTSRVAYWLNVNISPNCQVEMIVLSLKPLSMAVVVRKRLLCCLCKFFGKYSAEYSASLLSKILKVDVFSVLGRVFTVRYTFCMYTASLLFVGKYHSRFVQHQELITSYHSPISKEFLKKSLKLIALLCHITNL